MPPRHRGNSHACGPIQQRVTHGAGDFVNRRIGGRDIQQPALAFIQCEALGFHLQRKLRDLEASEGRALGHRAASEGGTLPVRGIQQPGVCLGDIPLAIRLARDASRAFGLVHGGVADAKASCYFARGGCNRTELDPLGHPGKRHYAIRFAGGLQGSSPASVYS